MVDKGLFIVKLASNLIRSCFELVSLQFYLDMKYSPHEKYNQNCYLQRHKELRVMRAKKNDFQERIVDLLKIVEQKLQTDVLAVIYYSNGDITQIYKELFNNVIGSFFFLCSDWLIKTISMQRFLFYESFHTCYDVSCTKLWM